ncbi:ejaculatory bulb-specific protein 3-like [Trichoplusia ni]|uniref:Ejaculatory bulb-specific protein 3-like n=1 Tax=Trichoplusia ni TaxID=7111 RepID=A0A7E5WJJ0_TRINI|nr:ejaculatory bulb-specific protein 3-like [Trichoplusia ni]
MKLVLIAVAISLCCVQAQLYSTKYDNINLDEVLRNRRLLNGYMKCTLDQGPCTAEGKELKYYISDGLKTGCAKCSDPQRKGIKKVMNHLIKHEPRFWQQAVDKYDPQRQYTKMYEKEVSNW